MTTPDDELRRIAERHFGANYRWPYERWHPSDKEVLDDALREAFALGCWMQRDADLTAQATSEAFRLVSEEASHE